MTAGIKCKYTLGLYENNPILLIRTFTKFPFFVFFDVKDFALKNNTTLSFQIDKQTFTNIYRVTLFLEEDISYEELFLTCVIGQF